MNRRMVMNTVGKIILAESVFLLLPAAVALIYREACLLPILLTSAFAFLTGGCLSWFCKPKDSVIYAREGFMIVSLSWGVLSMIGALPFWLSGEIPSYVDALFEIVSGFTTTGASILPDVEAMSRGLLFWRSFTHWIGGMGILVFVMAVLPNVSERSIHILRAEAPGPVVGKLVPRMKDTAKILYLIYLVMTGVQILLLLAGGMSPFAAIIHAFGTAGTGGFGIKADSLVEGEGTIEILGGTVSIKAGDDGLQAVTDITITEGATVTVNAADKDVNSDGTTNIAEGTLISK